MKNVFLLFLLSLCTNLNAQVDSTLSILFDTDKSIVPDSAYLQIIKKIFSQYPQKIEIIGHCDSVGSSGYNLALSKRRANAVRKILLNNGVDASKIKICMGYGENKPIASNASVLDRQLNRRVELICIGSNAKENYTKNKEVINVKNKPTVDIIVEKIDLAKQIKDKNLQAKDFMAGSKIILQNILFEPATHRLKESSYFELEQLYELLKNNTKVTIEIQGHVCCTYPGVYDGTDIEYNTPNLSVTRAREIYYQLIDRGIDKKRLRYKGFGGSRKISNIELTEEDKSVNRRVEIQILTQ